MVRLCFSLFKVASCFCLPATGKTKVKTGNNPPATQEPAPTPVPTPEPVQDANARRRHRHCASRADLEQPPQRREPSIEILCPPRPPSSTGTGLPREPVGVATQTRTPIIRLNSDYPNENLIIDWTSGARKETTTINWTVKEFYALCELKELLRNETLVFSAGHTVGLPTRWCFNLQKMKNESHIGLFLKRLKPLSFDEDDDEYKNRNRNTETPLLVAAGPGVGGGNQLAPTEQRASYSSIADDTDTDVDDAVYIHYECIIKRSGHGDLWLHKRTCIPNFEVGQRLGFRKLFTIEDLRDAEKTPNLWPMLSTEGTLHLEIRFNIHLRSNGRTKSEMNLLDSMTQENNERFHHQLLSAELSGLLVSGRNTDVILLMEADDKAFSVHKLVLSARSSMFDAMFHSGMKESQTGIVRIKEVTSKAMETLLCYVYSGKPNVDMRWGDVREVQDLIYAADKYAIKGLRDMCDQMMISGCVKDNAMELLYLAQAHNLNVAVRKISTFIKRNVDDVLCPNIKRVR